MHIQKNKNGKHRAQVSVNGIRRSAAFKKKNHATEWANLIKFQLDKPAYQVSKAE